MAGYSRRRGLPTISSIDRSLNVVTSCLLLIVRHFAERGAVILRLTSFTFRGFRMASRLHSSMASAVDGKENGSVHHQRNPGNSLPSNDDLDA
jgi:hypothetical protein